MLEGRGPGLVLKQDGPWVRSVSGSQGLCSWGGIRKRGEYEVQEQKSLV